MTVRPIWQPIHVSVDRIAATSPGAIAVVHDAQRISYRTLAAAGDAYAHRLASWGVRQGDVVPLLLPRSAQLVAVQLGVLKCGAAYTGIDPRWPTTRVASILAQLESPTVVGRAQPGVASVVDCSIEPEPLADTALTAKPFPSPEVALDDPATIFFTSGTTGVSKGVVTTHRAVTRLFGTGGINGFGPGHVTPQAAPLPWDMYAFELWGQLTTGGTSVTVEEDHLMPRRLRELIAGEHVDTVWLTTSLFNLFVDEDLDSFAGVERLYVGGEKQSSDHVARFLQRHPEIPVWNGYGPAENCMLSTLHPMTPADAAVPGGIPVGRAVPGTTVVIVRDGGVAPAGEVGEIVVAGAGLAKGYLNDEALTEQKFIRIPIDGHLVRAYRTGDLGFFDELGVLHYRDRVDRQIKLNGNRIELGDIESAARQLPGVRSCVAIAMTSSDGRVDRIRLFYTGADEKTAPTPRDVRKQLGTRLPAYAQPSTVERVDALPMSANGKIDARALSERIGR